MYRFGSFEPLLYKAWQIRQLTNNIARKNLVFFQRYGLIDLLSFPVRYQLEAAGKNVYLTIEDMLKIGPPYFMDCEDFAAWLLAQCWYNSIPAKVRLERQNLRLFHVLDDVWLNHKWTRIDPSFWKGM